MNTFDTTLYPFPREPLRYADQKHLYDTHDLLWAQELSRICFNHAAWTVAASYLSRWERLRVDCGFKVLKPIRIVPYVLGTDTTHVDNEHYGVYVDGQRVYPPEKP